MKIVFALPLHLSTFHLTPTELFFGAMRRRQDEYLELFLVCRYLFVICAAINPLNLPPTRRDSTKILR